MGVGTGRPGIHAPPQRLADNLLAGVIPVSLAMGWLTSVTYVSASVALGARVGSLVDVPGRTGRSRPATRDERTRDESRRRKCRRRSSSSAPRSTSQTPERPLFSCWQPRTWCERVHTKSAFFPSKKQPRARRRDVDPWACRACFWCRQILIRHELIEPGGTSIVRAVGGGPAVLACGRHEVVQGWVWTTVSELSSLGSRSLTSMRSTPGQSEDHDDENRDNKYCPLGKIHLFPF